MLPKYAVPGGRVDTIWKQNIRQEFLFWKPDLSILIIGDNDIDAHTDPKVLAEQITVLAQEIEASSLWDYGYWVPLEAT